MTRRLWLHVCVLWLFAASTAWAEQDHQVRTLLIPEREAAISSQFSGRIMELMDHIGLTFKKDDVLVRFDCAELTARLQMAEAELESASVTLNAKQELFKLQSAGETEVALAGAAVSRANAMVAIQKAQVGACEIRAPFDGSVVKVSARAFESVNLSQPILEIISNRTPKTRMNIPSSWLGWLKAGAPFKLRIDETGRSYDGHISAISERVDAVSQTVEAEGEIEGAKGLVAGMSGYAFFSPVRRTR